VEITSLLKQGRVLIILGVLPPIVIVGLDTYGYKVKIGKETGGTSEKGLALENLLNSTNHRRKANMQVFKVGKFITYVAIAIFLVVAIISPYNLPKKIAFIIFILILGAFSLGINKIFERVYSKFNKK
jgi:hypothetical protein